MDPLTHTMTGLALSRAGLNRITPRATAIVLLAANAPDIDVVTSAAGPLAYLNWHRHLTHALVIMPVMAVLPVLVVRLFSRKPLPWLRAYLASLIALATHPLLDLTNVYGIRLGLPFTARWFRLDIANLIDVWIWVLLFLAAIAPLFSRLVSSEIGARPSSGRGAGIFALVFLTLHLGGRGLLHERAVTVLESRIYQGRPPQRVLAMPGAFNPFRWRGLVEGEDFYSVHDVDLLGEFDPTLGRVYYKAAPSPAIEAARRTDVFQDFLRFSQYPFWRVVPVDQPENGTRVEVMDLRFGAPIQPRFVATAIVDGNGRVVRAWYRF